MNSIFGRVRFNSDRLELVVMLAILVVSIIFFGSIAPGFYSGALFSSMAFQLPELGLLTLAMFIPIISGGLNLAVTYSANISALLGAFFIKAFLMDSDWVCLPAVLSIGVGSGVIFGILIGFMVAYVGAHPILVTLGAMILLRGVGEWTTRGGDISGMPEVFNLLGHSSILGIPVPMVIFLLVVCCTFYIMDRTKEGVSIYMVGSNPVATEYSGIAAKKKSCIGVRSVRLTGRTGRSPDAGPFQFRACRAWGFLSIGNNSGMFSCRCGSLWRIRKSAIPGCCPDEPPGDFIRYESYGCQPAPDDSGLGCLFNHCDGNSISVSKI